MPMLLLACWRDPRGLPDNLRSVFENRSGRPHGPPICPCGPFRCRAQFRVRRKGPRPQNQFREVCTLHDIITLYLAERGDWVPSYSLSKLQTKWGWIGSSGERRARELAEDGEHVI